MPTPWTKQEEKKLIAQIKKRVPYEQIAQNHNRSISALLLRVNKIIFDYIQAGKDRKVLEKVLNMSSDKIRQAYYEHKAFLEKKKLLNQEPTNTINNANNNSLEKLQKENLLLKQIIKKLQGKLKNVEK
jgi:hypothetical protein